MRSLRQDKAGVNNKDHRLMTTPTHLNKSFNIDTTSTGVIDDDIFVNPTMSANKMATF